MQTKRYRRQSLADQQLESDEEFVAQGGRNVMQLKNEAALGFDQRMTYRLFIEFIPCWAQFLSVLFARWPATWREWLLNGPAELL